MANECQQKVSIRLSKVKDKQPQFEGKKWNEFSEHFIQINQRNSEKLKGNQNISNNNNEMISKLLKDYNDIKEKVLTLEEENQKLKESLGKMQENINDKFDQLDIETKSEFKKQEEKIDSLCYVTSDMSSGIKAILERLNIEPSIGKLKKSKLNKSHDDPY